LPVTSATDGTFVVEVMADDPTLPAFMRDLPIELSANDPQGRYERAFLRIPDGVDRVTIRMCRGVSLGVRVVGAGGREPIAGAHVVARSEQWRRKSVGASVASRAFEADTDPTGEVAFRKLDHGTGWSSHHARDARVRPARSSCRTAPTSR